MNVLSKYSAITAAIALVDFIIIFAIKSKFSVPEKLNSVIPFAIAMLLAIIALPFSGGDLEIAVKDALTSGGLATVLYSITGGFNPAEEEQIKKLLCKLLKDAGCEEEADETVEQLLNSLGKDPDDELVVVTVSSLIEKKLDGSQDKNRVALVTEVFVQAFFKLLNNGKKKS